MTQGSFQLLYHTIPASYSDQEYSQAYKDYLLQLIPTFPVLILIRNKTQCPPLPFSSSFMYIWGLPLTSNKFQLPWFSFNSLDLHFSFHWRQFCNTGFLQQALVSGQWSNDDVIVGFFAAKHFSFRHYCLCYV